MSPLPLTEGRFFGYKIWFDTLSIQIGFKLLINISLYRFAHRQAPSFFHICFLSLGNPVLRTVSIVPLCPRQQKEAKMPFSAPQRAADALSDRGELSFTGNIVLYEIFSGTTIVGMRRYRGQKAGSISSVTSVPSDYLERNQDMDSVKRKKTTYQINLYVLITPRKR